MGSIQKIEAVWDDDGARVGRLENGTVVSLGFVPEAESGATVIVHLGIPVEVLPAVEAEAALALQGEERA